MNVRLTQIDGKLPNLALMKLARHYRAQGASIHFTKHVERDMLEPEYDRVYGSAIFSFSADRVAKFRQQFPAAVVGGTWNKEEHQTVEHHLGLPESEAIDYSIYPNFGDVPVLDKDSLAWLKPLRQAGAILFCIICFWGALSPHAVEGTANVVKVEREKHGKSILEDVLAVRLYKESQCCHTQADFCNLALEHRGGDTESWGGSLGFDRATPIDLFFRPKDLHPFRRCDSDCSARVHRVNDAHSRTGISQPPMDVGLVNEFVSVAQFQFGDGDDRIVRGEQSLFSNIGGFLSGIRSDTSRFPHLLAGLVENPSEASHGSSSDGRYQRIPVIQYRREPPSRVEEYVVTFAIFGALAYAAYWAFKDVSR